MKANKTIRIAVSLTLMLAVTSVFGLGSRAASAPATVARDDASTAFVGKLTGAGELTIDGAAAQPGATVVSGSRVATGADGVAVIDLGSLGQIALRPNTTISLTFSAVAVNIKLEGFGAIDGSLEGGVTGKVQTAGAWLRLRAGEANLRSASGMRFLHAGEAAEMTADAEVVISGSATFTAESSASAQPVGEAQSGATTTATEGGASTPASPGGVTIDPAHAGITTAGLGGLLAMAGVATGVAAGIMAGSNHNTSTPAVRPSTVTP